MSVYEDTKKGLEQAVAIKNGTLKVEEVPGLPAKTYRVVDPAAPEDTSGKEEAKNN